MNNFTEGKIFLPMLKFATPIFFAMLLQMTYGAIDLLIVGIFASSADVSAVSTGSQLIMTLTMVIVSLSMGTTILIGQQIGGGKSHEAGKSIGSGICLYSLIALLMTAITVVFANQLAIIMNAPPEAFKDTVTYIYICGSGSIFFVAYNVIGSIFRGLGDSKTPLITVTIASILNVIGDLILVGYFNLDTAGAAIATVFAQAISVILSLLIIKKREFKFNFSKKNICFNKNYTMATLKLGSPIAIQSFLVNISFLVIIAIVNDLGLIASAGVGITERLCGFLLLVPMSFGQALAAFVAHNIGAKQYKRAKKSLLYSIYASLSISFVIAYASFFHGNFLLEMFSNDSAVIEAGWEYLKSYSFDVVLTSFMFCFIGYFNGNGKTTFVMIQGIIGAFLVRIPVSYIMAQQTPVSLFLIGLATPASTFLQNILCIIYFIILSKKLCESRGDELI